YLPRLFCFHRYRDHLHLHSFPTRRSSDLVPLSALAIAGRHNALNAMAALALGALAGAPMPRMIEALKAFRGLPHRVEPIACRERDRKSTRLNSSHVKISYAVFCLKKKNRK